MYIAAELTDCSLPEIAREFGKKNHTTIMYARDKVKDIMARDEAYRNKVRALTAPFCSRQASSTMAMTA